MKTDKDIQVVVNPSTDGKPVVIRLGKAIDELPVHERVNVHMDSTDIFGPGKYWKYKKQLYKAEKSTVLFDKNNGKIKLVLMEDSKTEHDTVNGVLTHEPRVLELRINTNDKISHKDMMKRLRWARSLFPSRDQYEAIISALQNFKAKIETEINKSNDNTGNITESVIVKTTQEVPLAFNLKSNLFVGQPEVDFDVMIVVDLSGRDLVYGLESLTLFELQNKIKSEIIDKALSEMQEIVHLETKL